jgi:spore coat protein CotH
MRPPGGFGPQGGPETAATPGQRIAPADVKPASSADLYDANTLRTLFLDFENEDWEAELEAFHGTDVEVPATLTVDGRIYPGVGIHFRGMSSYMMVRAGLKRSFNVSLDFTNQKQRLGGVKTLNLLNSNGDGSFLSAVLFSHLARKHLPTPRVNLVRVVINGENWGVYVNQEQFNKDFVRSRFGTELGARWKVNGSPNGQGGLDYIGDDPAPYRQRYTMKAGDDDDWHALVRLCKTLCETPADKLEAALEPILDLDGALWFLTLDCGLINSDGYWTRASDYSLYRDPKGKFHIIPCDMNEAFRAPEGGPGGPGGPGGGPPRGMRPNRMPEGPQPESGIPGQGAGPQPFPQPPGPFGRMPRVEGVKLDPLVGMDDARKPLRSKLLAVPALRERYLAHVRTFAQEGLDWTNLGPVVARYRALIAKEVAADTRKLSTTEEFLMLTADTPPAAAAAATAEAREMRRGPGHGGMALRTFADQRREFLLADPRVQATNAKN